MIPDRYALRHEFNRAIGPTIRNNRSIALTHNLDVGGEYEVVVATGDGLCHYRLRDRVRVDAIIKCTPSIRFIHRSTAVSDLVGEKLSEGFVTRILYEL